MIAFKDPTTTPSSPALNANQVIINQEVCLNLPNELPKINGDEAICLVEIGLLEPSLDLIKTDRTAFTPSPQSKEPTPRAQRLLEGIGERLKRHGEVLLTPDRKTKG